MEEVKLSELIRFTFYQCGHTIWAPAGQRASCTALCEALMDCGHGCARPCHKGKGEHCCGLFHEDKVGGNNVQNNGESKEDSDQAEPADNCSHEISGGLENCLIRLICGHVCKKKCHGTNEEHECTNSCPGRPCGHACSSNEPHCASACSPCWVMVTRRRDFCGHEYNMRCGKDGTLGLCGSLCGRLRLCGHYCRFICAQHGKDRYDRPIICPPCEEPVTGIKIIPDCGHEYEALVPCSSRNLGKLLPLEGQICDRLCGAKLICGHECRAKCQDCVNRSHHERCVEPCRRVFPCGHKCSRPCGNNCDYCTQECKFECEHSKCKLPCGQLCLPCKEPCSYGCEHTTNSLGQCTQECSEPCDKAPCEFPCGKLLPCNHPCVGFCGEPCPPLCRLCDGYPLGLLISRSPTVHDRFIYLRCGHTVPTAIAEISAASKRPVCTQCNQDILPLRRFSRASHTWFQAKHKEKLLILGRASEICKCCKQALLFLKTFKFGCSNKQFQAFKNYVQAKLNNPNGERNGRLSLREAESLLFLSWIFDYLTSKWSDLKVSNVSSTFIGLFLSKSCYLLELLMTLPIPLYDQELVDALAELRRIQDLCAFVQVKDIKGNLLPEHLWVNGTAISILKTFMKSGRYTVTDREQVFQFFRELVASTNCVFALSGPLKPPPLSSYKIDAAINMKTVR